MIVFFIGYMGCGKSRWGKLIAEHYGIRFIDLDKFIEQRENLSIPEIFEQFGESGFRQRELATLQSIPKGENIIVATGGGTPCFSNNIEEMNRTGVTLYIEASPELLQQRITNSKTKRPLLKSLSKEELLSYIKKHLQARLPFYNQARYKLSSDNLKLNDFVQVLDSVINH